MGSKGAKLGLKGERVILKDLTRRADAVSKYAKSDPEKAKKEASVILADFDKSVDKGDFAVHYWTGMDDELAMMKSLGHSSSDIADTKKLLVKAYPGRVKLRRAELQKRASGAEVKVSKAIKPTNPNSSTFVKKDGTLTVRGTTMLRTLNKSKKIKGTFKMPNDVSQAKAKLLITYGNEKASKSARESALKQYNAINTIISKSKSTREIVKASPGTVQKRKKK